MQKLLPAQLDSWRLNCLCLTRSGRESGLAWPCLTPPGPKSPEEGGSSESKVSSCGLSSHTSDNQLRRYKSAFPA